MNTDEHGFEPGCAALRTSELLNYLKAAGGGVGMLWQSGPRNSRNPPVTRDPDRVGGCDHRMTRSAVGAAGAVARLSTFTTIPPEWLTTYISPLASTPKELTLPRIAAPPSSAV